MRTVMRNFWPVLDNSISMLDISNTFSMSLANSEMTALDNKLFSDFVQALARLKYPTSTDYVANLLEDLNKAKKMRVAESPLNNRAFDRNVCRIFMKFDHPLRRAFCSFAGSGAHIGAGVSWEEVKRLGIGMEVDGFVNFCAASSILPEPISTEQCVGFAKQVLSQHPLLVGVDTQHSLIMYPHFQMLLCRLAVELGTFAMAKEASRKPGEDNAAKFARKVTNAAEEKPLANLLTSLLKALGIDKAAGGETFSFLDAEGGRGGEMSLNLADLKFPSMESPDDANVSADGQGGEVIAPAVGHPMDSYSAFLNQGRRTMALRMEHLLDEVEARLMKDTDPGDRVIQLLAESREEAAHNATHLAIAQKFAAKPVVVGDAIPVPSDCPPAVEQLLEAALAHHNLGSYEDGLKFLEAARLQLEEMEVKRATDALKEEMEETPEGLDGDDSAAVQASLAALEVKLPLELDMYIALCKGNVYQSSGDDENSLQQYLNAWARAGQEKSSEWEVVALNSIGMLAYYTLRYEVCLMCFHRVAAFREEMYGSESADTATAVNNEGCALFALGNRSAARIRFEQSWGVICKVLGHRHPRAVAVWKNLERGRRSQASLKRGDLQESVDLRSDADKLLYNGQHTIKAIPPPEPATKKKGGKKKGGKKKK